MSYRYKPICKECGGLLIRDISKYTYNVDTGMYHCIKCGRNVELEHRDLDIVLEKKF